MKIFLADANRDSRLGMQMLLDHQTGMRIIGVSVGSEGLVDQVNAAQPDVVLLDWQIIASAPAEYIKNLHLIESQPQIIVICIQPEIRREAEDAGADAFISKDKPPDELLSVLRKIGKDEEEG